MSFISVVKESYVNIQAQALKAKGGLMTKTWYKDQDKNKHILCRASWAEGLILNGSHQDLLVQYVEYEEIDNRTQKTCYHNEWITDLPISATIIFEFVELAPCRWKIENETFNTLKNQGYSFEHNYGHGKQFLSIVFVMLMLLAFFVDQLTAFADKTFQEALNVVKTIRDLRQTVRALFSFVPCESFEDIFRIIARHIHLKMMEV
jgi:Na+-transporting methylmalonyl-CoA/oxaloacetate decarboxylase gamma subunit